MKIQLPTTVKVSLNEILDCDAEAFLDLLAEAAVGSPLLMQITWRLVGSEPPRYLFIEVDGDTSAIEETPEVKARCKNCGDLLFETDKELSSDHGEVVWSHTRNSECADPVPEEGAWSCPGCGERGEPQEALGRKPDRYFLVRCTTKPCEYEDYWHVPFTEADYAEDRAAKAEHDKDSREDR